MFVDNEVENVFCAICKSVFHIKHDGLMCGGKYKTAYRYAMD